MKKLLAITLLCCAHQICVAQFNISGQLDDTLDMKSIPFASIALITQSDSTLVQHTRSTPKGFFTLNNIDSGKYRLLISHAKYFILSKKIEVTNNTDLGKLKLYQKGRMLKEVLIRSNDPITIRGDTVQYFADSFKTKEGAVVEDLLKILPGLEVDENGNIKAQGKTVEKVLVNGEEFFGSDPTIATQNLPSKAVEKVEVYDYKDEQESFTGFSGDKDVKVVNLKLKKDMNKGGFVKLGSHSNIIGDRWEQKALINRFQDKEQMGVYFLSNSNKMASMSWDEAESMGNTNTNFSDDGMMFTSYNDDGDGSSNPFWNGAQYGLNKSWKAGGRYANKFEKRNQELNVNYSFLRSTRERELKQYTEQLLPNETINKTNSSKSFLLSNGHSFNTKYKTDLDSNLSLTYNFGLQLRTNQTESTSGTSNSNLNEVPISFNNRNSSNKNAMQVLSNGINLKKKFKKKSRTLSYRLSHKYRSNASNNFIQSTNALDLLNGGQTIVLDQKRQGDIVNSSINSNLVYTEPINKYLKLKINYGYAQHNNDNENIVLDTIGSLAGNYNRQLDSLSNIFESNQKSHQPGFVLRYEKDKVRISLSSDINHTSFIQNDLLRNNNFDYDQTNYIPGLRIKYKITKYKTINVSYTGRTQTPNAHQLQPFQDNTNPLDIVIGNPNLKMAYRQNINIRYSSYAPIEGRSSYVSLSGNNTLNQIGTARSFDEAGRTTTTYLNLPKSYGAYFYSYYSRKLGISNFRLGINANGRYNYAPNRINEVDGHSENLNFELLPGISYYNKDLLNFSLNLHGKFISNKNIGNVNRTIQYFAYKPSAFIELYFPQFITVEMEAVYNYTPAVAPYNTPFRRLFAEGSVSKKILRDKSLNLEFRIFDIFNQNQGYNRQSDINFNTESFYNTIGRYWMVGATWNILYGPANAKKKKTDKGISGKGWYKKKETTDKKETTRAK